MLLVFFVVALIAYVIIRIFESKKQVILHSEFSIPERHA